MRDVATDTRGPMPYSGLFMRKRPGRLAARCGHGGTPRVWQQVDVVPSVDKNSDMNEPLPAWSRLLDLGSLGDALAWEEISRRVQRLARGLRGGFASLGTPDWEDIIQDTLARLLHVVHDHQIRGGSDGEVAVYVRQMLRRRALDVVHRERRVQPSANIPLAELAAPPYESAQDWRLTIEKFLQGYEKSWREIFICKLHGIDSRTIQRRVERIHGEYISAATVDTRCARMRNALAEWIGR
jgi:DNA-directed RNA polymerase specialized sigma24 family protein